MTIHTTSTLRANRHRLERRMEKAAAVLAEMEAGATLHLMFRAGPCWVLSNGRRVDDAVAKLVITSASIVDVGDSLFVGCPAQTFRWWGEVPKGALR